MRVVATFWTKVADELGLGLASPLYTAPIVADAGVVGALEETTTTERVDASPALESGSGPETSWPLMVMLTVPVGWMFPGRMVVTVTVRANAPPDGAGLVSLAMVVVVLARLTVWATVSELALKRGSPL